MTQEYPILKVNGDPPGSADGPAIFEFPNATVTPLSITDYLAKFGGDGGLTSLITQGEQIAIDAGGGPKNFEIEFTGWTDSNDYQWGTTDNQVEKASSATGGDRTTQASVLVETLDQIDIGSNNPAQLYYGEWSRPTTFGASSGFYDPVDVAIPEVNVPVPHNEQASTFNGSLTLISTETLSDLGDRTGIPP